MPISYELDISLGRELTGIVHATTERVNLRRASIGFPPLNSEEISARTRHFVAENNRGAIMWNQVSLVRDRARLEALNPTVALYASLCEDGRLDRPTRGAVSSIKTEHGQVTLQYVESKGIWIPKDLNVQKSLEDPYKTPLNLNKIHNRDCKAWRLTLDDLRSPVWDYISQDQKKHIYEISQQDPVLGNMVFEELTNSSAYDNYYFDVHGVRRRTSVSMVYDPHTTGVELITPLVRFNEQGQVVSLPRPEEMEKFVSTDFVDAIVKLQEELQDPNIPELGKYKDNYFDPDVFPQFFHELVDLTVALSTGKVEKEDGTVWTVPEPLMDLRRRFIDRFVMKGFTDFAPDSKEAMKHHTIYASWREYLLKGQTKTKDHAEVLASGSDNGSNLLKYVPWEQSIRYSIPVGSGRGVTRFMVAKSVLDIVSKDKGVPHLNFVISNSKDRSRELFDLLEGEPTVSDTITTGAMFPLVGVIDGNGMFVKAVPEAVRML